MSSLKIFLILIILNIFLVSVNAYHCSEIKITSENPEKTVSFNIHKTLNYTYNMSFTHYGNIKNYTTVEIYLNNHLLYTIKKSNNNTGSGNYKKSVSINITNYLNNGENTLKMRGDNMNALNYTPYYTLENIYINEPIKSSVPTPALIIGSLLITIIILKNKNSNKN